MKKQFRSLLVVTLLGTTTVSVLSGCGGAGTTPDQASNQPQTVGDGASSSSTPSGTANAGAVAQDAGFQPKIVETTESAAQQVVAVFLDSLRKGDEVTANATLTTIARAEIAKTAYTLRPLGTPEGQFKIGRLGFPYQDQNIALVECQWKEPASGTDPEILMDFVFEVHLEQQGWRIAGMAVTEQGESEPLVIDFEDSARLNELQRMMSGAEGQPTAPQAGSGQIAQPGQMQNPAGFSTVSGPPSGTQLPSGPTQFGQAPQQPSFGGIPNGTPGVPSGALPGGVNLPPLPNFPSGPDSQLATPPGGNVLR